jgi:hypothetical protein
VDAHCWADMQSNEGEGSVTGEQSMDYDVHNCRPTNKTKSFDVVLNNWTVFKLDHDGNIRAVQFVHHIHKEPVYCVNVSGDIAKKKTLRVTSIANRPLRITPQEAAHAYY